MFICGFLFFGGGGAIPHSFWKLSFPNHEIKRCLLLGKKAMTNLGSVGKSKDITLSPADTMAMAGMAFSCLELSNLNPKQRNRINLALKRVQEKILKAQTPEGYFGNVYSTPLALQVGKRLRGHALP